MSTRARIDFCECVQSSRRDGHSTEWYDRILFYSGNLYGRNFGPGPGDVLLAEMYTTAIGVVAKVEIKGQPYSFERFDIIIHDDFGDD